MSATEVFRQAYAVLGAAPGGDPREVKRAYRRALLEHPPDRDPEGFKRLRDAYEIISSPLKRGAQGLLSHPTPFADFPKFPKETHEAPPDAPGAAAVAVLRMMAATHDPPPAAKGKKR